MQARLTVISPSSVLHMHDLPSLLVASLADRELARPNPIPRDLLVQPHPHRLAVHLGTRKIPRLSNLLGEVRMALLPSLLDERSELDEEVDEGELGVVSRGVSCSGGRGEKEGDECVQCRGDGSLYGRGVSNGWASAKDGEAHLRSYPPSPRVLILGQTKVGFLYQGSVYVFACSLTWGGREQDPGLVERYDVAIPLEIVGELGTCGRAANTRLFFLTLSSSRPLLIENRA